MLVLNSKGMRRLVHTAAVIFLLGIALQMLINLFEPGNPAVPGFLSYLAYFAMVTGPFLLMLTMFITLTRERKKSAARSAQPST
jgi:predicted tellurium resistance membrane protein TerC